MLGAAVVPDGTGRQIWIAALRCVGTETRLIDCPRGSVSGCSHVQDAGVTCMQLTGIKPLVI